MPRIKTKTVTLPLCGDTGSAKLVRTERGDLGVIHIRQVDGRRFQVRSTDQHHKLAGVLQALPPPIDEALARSRITEEQHAAAQRFARDYAVGVASSLKGVDLTDRQPGAPGDNWRISNRQAEAMRSWRIASDRVKSLSQAHLSLMHYVVIDELPANHAAKRLKLPARNGIGMLRQCLDQLAVHYGFAMKSRFWG